MQKRHLFNGFRPANKRRGPSLTTPAAARRERSGLWSAYATQRAGRGRKQRTEIGAYRGEEEAARAYDRFVLDTQGPRAITNFPAADYAGATP